MVVDRIDDGMWRLEESYTPEVFPDIVIPKGFVWNGASIPKIARFILSNEELGVLEASCTHDRLYANGGRVNSELKLTRKQVDTIFEHELKFYGIDSTRAYLAYQAVRMFGGSHWNA